MNPDESNYPSELADSDLDELLRAANTDLLAHIEAAADPASTLMALITHGSPGPESGTASHAVSGRPETEDTEAPQPQRLREVHGPAASGNRDRGSDAGTVLEPEPGLVLTAYRTSELASVATAVSAVTRQGIIAGVWHWRYELCLTSGLIAATVGTSVTLGTGWLAAATAATIAILAAALTWPPSRRRLIARAWCIITPHRVRTGCAQAWIQTRDGRLPAVLYTTPTDFGERVWLWCRAGITAEDLEAAKDILGAACWASDVQVVVNDRRSRIVALEVIRHSANDGPRRGRSRAHRQETGQHKGDRLFVMNDTEAYWRGWQMTRTHGGLGRRYRDPRFAALARCRTCNGTGRTADLGTADHTSYRPCARCRGTGRITPER